jgi:GMP synthase-like glutamine amidotransferase
MHTLVVANRGDDDPGYVGARLVEHGARLTTAHRDEPDRLPRAAAGADLLVLLGSDWSVHDPARGREVAAEAEVVRQAVRRGVPVLAICYGAQLAASAFGARVTRAARPEIGWRHVESDDPDLLPSGPWFQLHHDRWWDAGPVASMARTDDAPQAFRIDRLLAVQFHPEVTPGTAERWLRESASTAEQGHDEQDVEQMLHQFDDAAATRAGMLVDTFMTAFAGAPLSAIGADTRR